MTLLRKDALSLDSKLFLRMVSANKTEAPKAKQEKNNFFVTEFDWAALLPSSSLLVEKYLELDDDGSEDEPVIFDCESVLNLFDRLYSHSMILVCSKYLTAVIFRDFFEEIA